MKNKKVILIVAHPDDETLWAGGTILDNPTWDCFIVCLCRGNDLERAPRFNMVLRILHSKGMIADLNDDPEQVPLDNELVEKTILDLVPKIKYDIIITHNILGEYTYHLRHEEVSKAVLSLWKKGSITGKELWFFAYSDANKAHLPMPVTEGTLNVRLTEATWQKKYRIITEIYGFDFDSWEAKTTPKTEAFWQFKKKQDAQKWHINCLESLLSI